MGYNHLASVIVETPDITCYSSGVFILRQRFVWIHALAKFLPIEDVSMHVYCILVKDGDQFLIFNNFSELLATSKTRIVVNDDGYIRLQDPSNYILEAIDGSNLYEEPFWYFIPFMGDKVEIPFSLIKESRFVKTRSGREIVELTEGVNVEIYENGVLIRDHHKYSYINTIRPNGKTVVNDADFIQVQIDCLRVGTGRDCYFIKDP